MKKIIESQIFVLSQTKKVSVPVQVCYTDNEVEMTINYNGAEYCAKGKDFLWVDVFADLQRKLPNDIQLACCMTCRYGNMCPYGNKENQLYCTKDVRLTSKDDVIELVDKERESFFERGVLSIHCCDDFICQSDDCYTYNDYLYYLQKN